MKTRFRRVGMLIFVGSAVGGGVGLLSSTGQAAHFECVQYESSYVVDAVGHWAIDRSCTATYPYVYGGGCELDSGNPGHGHLVAGYPSAVAERYRCEWYMSGFFE